MACPWPSKLYASKDKNDWGAPIKEWKGSKGAVTRLKLDAPVDAQFIKLEITRMNGAYGVSVAELEVWNIAGEAPSPAPEQQTPETNIARKAKVATSSNEDGNLTGEKAIDGNTSARESRWATKTGARPKSPLLATRTETLRARRRSMGILLPANLGGRPRLEPARLGSSSISVLRVM